MPTASLTPRKAECGALNELELIVMTDPRCCGFPLEFLASLVYFRNIYFLSHAALLNPTARHSFHPFNAATPTCAMSRRAPHGLCLEVMGFKASLPWTLLIQSLTGSQGLKSFALSQQPPILPRVTLGFSLCFSRPHQWLQEG